MDGLSSWCVAIVDRIVRVGRCYESSDVGCVMAEKDVRNAILNVIAYVLVTVRRNYVCFVSIETLSDDDCVWLLERLCDHI